MSEAFRYSDTKGKCFARVYNIPLEDKIKSLEEGRPIFKEEMMIDIHIPGGRNVVTHKVRHLNPEQLEEFSKEIENFKKNLTETPVGTSLQEWPAITRSMAEELRHFQIFTVEQLASASDTAIQNLGMGMRALREKARAFLEKAADNAVTDRFAKENMELKDQLKMMQEQIKELRDKINEEDKKINKKQAKLAEG
ncbi:MAG: hypothetical protein AB7F19_07720 [Candidatus Babeliales bacterium]